MRNCGVGGHVAVIVEEQNLNNILLFKISLPMIVKVVYANRALPVYRVVRVRHNVKGLRRISVVEVGGVEHKSLRFVGVLSNIPHLRTRIVIVGGFA